jgi:hypothetical protein
MSFTLLGILAVAVLGAVALTMYIEGQVDAIAVRLSKLEQHTRRLTDKLDKLLGEENLSLNGPKREPVIECERDEEKGCYTISADYALPTRAKEEPLPKQEEPKGSFSDAPIVCKDAFNRIHNDRGCAVLRRGLVGEYWYHGAYARNAQQFYSKAWRKLVDK